MSYRVYHDDDRDVMLPVLTFGFTFRCSPQRQQS